MRFKLILKAISIKSQLILMGFKSILIDFKRSLNSISIDSNGILIRF